MSEERRDDTRTTSQRLREAEQAVEGEGSGQAGQGDGPFGAEDQAALSGGDASTATPPGETGPAEGIGVGAGENATVRVTRPEGLDDEEVPRHPSLR